MKHILMAVACAAAVSLPDLSQAQTFSGSVTLGYGQGRAPDVSDALATTTLDGRMLYDTGNGLVVAGELSGARVSSDGLLGDLSGSSLGLEATQRLHGGLSLGGYVEQNRLDTAEVEAIKATSFGIEAGYAIGAANLALFVGQSRTNFALLNAVDVRDLGLTVRYAVGDRLSLGAALVNSAVPFLGADIDLRFLGLAATYSMNDRVSLFGGLTEASIQQFGFDVRTLGLGLSYDMSGVVPFDTALSVELARTSIGFVDSTSVDTVRLGLTFPMGGDETRAPLNSVADTVFNPRRNALSQLLLGVF